MNRKNMQACLLAIVTIAIIIPVNAQDQVGGTIMYQQTTSYSFPPTGNPEWDEYAKTLPTEGQFDKVLYFTSDFSLYEEPTFEKEAMSEMEMKAYYMARHGKAPRSELKRMYCDFNKNSRTEQLDFMTREFLLEEEIPVMNWRLSPSRKRVLDYTCMEAVLISDEDTIKAWFTPEIPVSTGPAEYFGLPGVVLAVEKNNETIYLATLIELAMPGEELLVEPEEGKKVTRDEMDQIIREKTEEYHKTVASKGARSNIHK